MGWKSFLKQQLREGGGSSKSLLIGGGVELELTKHFRLLRKLGKGSYATVYKAERLTDGQRYALKITDLDSLSRMDKVAVVEEIRLLASLDHPNIISYYEAFCDHDQLCVVTELVTGGDLGSFLSKMREAEDFLWERQVWGYFLQVALGVQYLHHNHVLHRDLKPQNIMLTKKNGSGLLKIVDLGVSAELELVFTRVQIGTPHYMAPEMWEHKAYSYSADIWALGCILHELCTLRPTFLSESERTEEDIKRRVLAGRYAPIPTRYSMDLARLVGLMLQRDPKDRPTIDEILAMPEVRSKLMHLPPELQPLAAAAEARDSRAHMEAQLQLPDDSHAFNCMMPPARYPTGPGVAELICARPQRRSFSLSDLQAAGAGGSASPQRPGSPPPGDQGDPHRASSAEMDGEQAAGGGNGRPRRSSGSMNDLARYEEKSRLRRRSIMVGELLYRLKQEQGEAPAGAAGAAGTAGTSAPGAASVPDQRQRRSLQDHTPAGGRRSASPPVQLLPPPQQPGQEEGGEEISLHGGMAYGPAGAAGTGAADAEGQERGRPWSRTAVMRRSVAVAE
ncbi:hypothetical protein ABPG75_011869, partial [Micractinium tetrahymenae]